MNLATLKNKEPKEILRLLSVVSSSLLPNPSVGKQIHQATTKPEIIDSVVNEIRHRLNISDDDYSVSAQSKIFDYLSKEISNVVLSDVNVNKVKKRLGGKGELPLSQYKITFGNSFKGFEVLGEKKNNVIETVAKPDKFLHLNSKYLLLGDESKFGATLLTKLVTPRRIQDKFIQVVVSMRQEDTLSIGGAFRAYFSEMNLNQLNNPLDILKLFIETYGLTFKLSGLTTKFIQNDVTELGFSLSTLDLKILNEQKGKFYLPVIIGNQSELAGTIENSENLSEILLGFAVDISKYSATLEKHNVHLDRGSFSGFLQIN